MAGEKKLIIDEDWKSQVEAEKEAAKQPPISQPADAQTAGAGEPSGEEDLPMPPASLEMLISTLVTEAMISLGQIPHPATGKAELRPNQAKYLIDTIAVLSEKTKGNVSTEEEQAFTNLLHQLRMAFVALTEQATKPV